CLASESAQCWLCPSRVSRAAGDAAKSMTWNSAQPLKSVRRQLVPFRCKKIAGGKNPYGEGTFCGVRSLAARNEKRPGEPGRFVSLCCGRGVLTKPLKTPWG